MEGEQLVVETDASCFYHPQSKAATLCAACGRFVCSLCDIEFEGQHYCPSCLETGRRKGKLISLENNRVLNDSIALHGALFSFLVFYVSFITAPATIYWAIKHWNTPGSLLRKSRWRSVAAIVMASLQIIGWIVFIFAMVLGK